MNRYYNGAAVETNGVRQVAGGGTGASTASQARTNLGAVGTDGTVTQIVQLTQAQYNALSTKVSTTLYLIVG